MQRNIFGRKRTTTTTERKRRRRVLFVANKSRPRRYKPNQNVLITHLPFKLIKRVVSSVIMILLRREKSKL